MRSHDRQVKKGVRPGYLIAAFLLVFTTFGCLLPVVAPDAGKVFVIICVVITIALFIKPIAKVIKVFW